jgi:ArsR family transcriptional regulator
MFRALGHESRLVILAHLADGECCVCDLAEITGLDQSTVSRHLALLSSTGLVDGERRGHHVYYRVIAPWVTELLRSRPWAPEEKG